MMTVYSRFDLDVKIRWMHKDEFAIICAVSLIDINQIGI